MRAFHLKSIAAPTDLSPRTNMQNVFYWNTSHSSLSECQDINCFLKKSAFLVKNHARVTYFAMENLFVFPMLLARGFRPEAVVTMYKSGPSCFLYFLAPEIYNIYYNKTYYYLLLTILNNNC